MGAIIAGSAAVLLVPGLTGTGAAASAAAARPPVPAEVAGATHLIVSVTPSAAPTLVHRVQQLGGSVTRSLPIVDATAVTVPSGTAAQVAAIPGVRSVSPDRPVRVLGTAADGGPASVFRQVTGSDAAARAGADGSGVGVALIDTGVAPVPDLADRIVPVKDTSGVSRPCLNLSGEPDCGDSYGHGTFVAGLIAGNGASSGGMQRGVAPGAHIVSIKVAGRDGSSDVSTVLAAIQWAVSFRDQYGIRVLNLSLGTDSTQSYRVDPLDYAVERAWAAGITVVVAAGNLGPAAGTVTKPADDPFVLSVGADDDRGTPGVGDDELPDFSGRGPTAADGVAKPDLIAPGSHLLSVRAPGSAIDTEFPPAAPGPYRRGSGTSMAAAVTSGAVALMLDLDPALTPDRVKYALTSTAQSAASTDPLAAGAGVLDAYRAVTAAPPGLANQGVARSNGLGQLDLSRGSVTVQSDGPVPTVLGTLTTAQLLLWQPIVYTDSAWSSASWYTSPFGVSLWPGTSWEGKNWQGKNWQGKNWQGATWYGKPDTSASYGRGGQGSASYGAWS